MTRETPLDEYERNSSIEAEYGAPDFESWRLYQAVAAQVSKLAAVQAFHLVHAALGLDIDTARGALNRHTLALYGQDGKGRFIKVHSKCYSEPHVFGFLYGTAPYKGGDQSKFESDIAKIDQILETPWAKRLMAMAGIDVVRDRLKSMLDTFISDAEKRSIKPSVTDE